MLIKVWMGKPVIRFFDSGPRFLSSRMRSRFYILLTLLVTLFGWSHAGLAQTPVTNAQTPTADEILRTIAAHCKLSPVADKILIAGQVRSSALTHRSRFSLTGVITVMGCFTAAGRSSEIDLREIRTGQIKDVSLQNCDVVFVPHISGEIPTSASQQPSVCPNVPAGRPWHLLDSPITPRRSTHDPIRIGLGRL